MHIFSLYDLLLPEGDSVVSPDAGVVPGAGFIVVANGPEVVTPKIIQCHLNINHVLPALFPQSDAGIPLQAL